MPAYAVTHMVSFSGPAYTPGTNINIHSASAASAESANITDGSGDVFTNNETVSESPSSPGVFFTGSATYVGTINVPGFGPYPVFEQFGGYYAVFADNGGLTGAAAAAQASSTGSFTVDASEDFVACFGEGTQIATPEGETSVEALQIGDMVRTADGRDVPVTWVGHQVLFPSDMNEHMQPVRIRAGALGENSPSQDLIVTADHAIYLDGYLVNAGALINRETIDFLPMSECDFRLRVYHIETEAHEVLVANGLTAESFLDQPNRKAFDNYDDYTAIYGEERTIREMPVPRISSARLLPTEIRVRILPKSAGHTPPRSAA